MKAIEILCYIIVLVCAVALALVDNSSCGKLHIVAMIYYIIVFIIFAFVGLIGCCFMMMCLIALLPLGL